MGVTKLLPEAIHAKVGLGTAPLAIEGRPNRHQAVKVIEAAIESEVGLIDTADAYCIDSGREHGYGERLVAEALRSGSDRKGIVVASKVGEWRPGDGSWQLRGHPSYLREACERSLKNLEVETIDLLQLHRPDPEVPIEESVGELHRLQQEGKVKHIGVSNVTASELQRALATAPIASVQNRLSVVDHFDPKVVELCEDHGLVLMAHSPFGGPGRANHIGRHSGLRKVAKTLGANPFQVAIAWMLRLSPTVLPIPGTTKPHRVGENMRAVELDLMNEEVWEPLAR